MKLIAATLGFAVLMTGAAVADGATKTDLTLFGKDPGDARAYACYTRVYDAAHLKTHPKQNVTDMSLLVDSTYSYDSDPAARTYSVSIGVHFRKVEKPFQVYGSCSGMTDSDGMLHCGVDCDGGQIDVKVKDANSILVEIPDGARVYDPSQPADADPGDGVVPQAEFGLDDKEFLLARASYKTCFDLLSDQDKELILDFSK